MTGIFVSQVADFVDQEVSLQGWASNVRSSGKISFVELRDGTGFIQCVAAKSDVTEDENTELKKLTRESSVKIRGKVAAHPKKENIFEIHMTGFETVQLADEFPIGRKEHGPDFLLNNRHLWLRSKKQWAIQRIRNTIINATYDFFRKEHFTKMDSPIITANACEGTTTLFEFEYFDLGKGYLSQSGQLYLEAAIGSVGRAFDFGPVFRAEKSKTRKHLTEFWMMDAEMAFCDHNQNMEMQEKMVCYFIKEVLEKNRADLEILERDVTALEKIKAPFPRVTHAEIVEKLQGVGSEITKDLDLGAGDETLLEQLYDQPLFIERWPTPIKAFYMKRDPEDEDIVLGADLMAPEGFGELIGGSQREDDHDVLLERLKEENLPLEAFQWYLDLRKYGSTPHSGFGFGLERIVAWIGGVEHIRETIPFPRMIYRYTP